MTAAEATCKEGGVIIDVSACSDGHGGEDFYNTLKDAADIQKAMDDILPAAGTKRSSTRGNRRFFCACC